MEVHVSSAEATGYYPDAGGATNRAGFPFRSSGGGGSENVGQESSRKLSKLESRADPTDHVLDQSVGLKKRHVVPEATP